MKTPIYFEKIKLSLLLAGVVFVAHELSGFLEQMIVSGIEFAWILLFLWYSGFFFLFLMFYNKWGSKK